jgi:hypothetical protein
MQEIMTSEAFPTEKRVNPQALGTAFPALYEQWKAAFASPGAQAFAIRKQFFRNDLRMALPRSDPESKEE